MEELKTKELPNIDYVKLHEGKKETIILVHGCGCNHKFLTPLGKLFKEHTVLSVNLPNRGNMNKQEVTAHEICEMLSTLISSIDNDVIIIGHSLGGGLVLGTATFTLPNLKGVVYINSACEFSLVNRTFTYDAINKGIVDRKVLLNACNNLYNPLVLRALTQFEKDDVICHDLNLCEQVNYTDDLSKIKCKVLGIACQKDPLVPIYASLNTKDALERANVDHEFIQLDKPKHMLPVSHKADVHDFIVTWMNNVK